MFIASVLTVAIATAILWVARTPPEEGRIGAAPSKPMLGTAPDELTYHRPTRFDGMAAVSVQKRSGVERLASADGGNLTGQGATV